MPANDPRIEQLSKRLDRLREKQEHFNDEINEIRREIQQLHFTESSEDTPDTDAGQSVAVTSQVNQKQAETKKVTTRFNQWIKTDLEKFIGENLINKIGILITIIGVAIGAQYVIDHELISPLMRIVAGYVLGAGLLAFAVRLKKKMENFSAVLFSGAMAIFYIVTFTAYSFYSLFSALPAFLLMAIITFITVGAALIYNRQTVAHIGLVGAYAIPFLVGGNGSATPLFIYMALINTGVLSVGIYKYWKALTFTAFAFTWLIYGSWYAVDYTITEHFATGLFYSFIFFLIFYLAALLYKLLREQTFKRRDVWLILANAFIFYGFGYSILSGYDSAGSWVGVFTGGNAGIHFIAAVLIYRSGLPDVNLFYLVTGLAITFLTIAIPVELDGRWVTLLWTSEAVLLFWIGRTQQVSFYEKMAHPVLLVAFASLLIEWNSVYPLTELEAATAGFTALFNIHFFTSLFFIAGISFIAWQDFQSDFHPKLYKNVAYDRLIRQLIWLTLIIATYFAFRLEIQGWFNQTFIASGNVDILRFKTLWVFNYTMFFISLLLLATNRWIWQKEIGIILFIAVGVCTALFLADGLSELGYLKDRYLYKTGPARYESGIFHIGIRYVNFLFLGLMLLATHRLLYNQNRGSRMKVAFDALLYITILFILSKELILWMDVATTAQPYKLGLTILWGSYALLIIGFGIKTRRKHLRLGAISLLGITLIKLFFYDITHLDAISRTIVFVTLGLLLLLASYLYNKFNKEIQL